MAFPSKTFGLNWEDYIDKDELIDDIINMDGFGQTLNNYDGEQPNPNHG